MTHIAIHHLSLLPALALALAAAALLPGCKPEEEAFLKPKVYFEETDVEIPVGDEKLLTYDLRARLTTMSEQDATITFSIGDKALVDEYNAKNSTEYLALDPAGVAISTNTAEIRARALYSDNIKVQISGLDKVEEGKSYLLPIRIQSSTCPIIRNTSVAYLLLKKPVKITRVWDLKSDYIKIPLPLTKVYKSLTYEALIRFRYLGSNNTIMGREGTLILRIGDSALPGGANNLIQIAGSKQFHSDKVKFVKDTWYHVAFTYDEGSGKATLYVNGEKVAESGWSGASFDIAPEMYIGKVAGFMWGERPFSGQMSEVRLWTVARTQAQIQKNMLSVDPASEGLEVYYKLNGKDQYTADDGKVYVRNQAGNSDLDGIANGGQGLRFITLPTPVEIK